MVGRRLRTPRDLGAAVRDERRARGLTQAELARTAGVSREWLIGVEQGKRPRAELEKILVVLAALELPLSIDDASPGPRPNSPSPAEGHGSLTSRATREAINEVRTAAAAVPEIAEYGRRATRLLGAAVDPELAAYLTRMSFDLVPAPGSPAETDEEAP